jgi:histone H3/H4
MGQITTDYDPRFSEEIKGEITNAMEAEVVELMERAGYPDPYHREETEMVITLFERLARRLGITDWHVSPRTWISTKEANEAFIASQRAVTEPK